MRVSVRARHSAPEQAESWDGPSSVSDFSGLRVLIVHDWMVTWAGSERCVEEMLRIFPEADLVVGVLAPTVKHANAVTRRAEETWLAHLPGARRHHRWFLPLEALAFASLDTSGYDLVISSSHAFAKMVRPGANATHVCYCYSPPRYLWDLSTAYQRDARGIQRLALASATGVLRRVDRWSARGVDHFVGISRYISDRIERCYGRHADVVYPPVSPKPLDEPVLPRENFLLSLGRLVPYKRVDLAIAAAKRLGVRLIIAGDGPERARLQAAAHGGDIEFLGEVSEEAAARLLSTCAAFVFCADEDFGIAPVEANAHGAPVVGLARGGLLETMVDGVTAELFHEESVDALTDAIRRALDRHWDVERLHENAQRFSPSGFRRGFARSIESALSASSVRG